MAFTLNADSLTARAGNQSSSHLRIEPVHRDVVADELVNGDVLIQLETLFQTKLFTCRSEDFHEVGVVEENEFRAE